MMDVIIDRSKYTKSSGKYMERILLFCISFIPYWMVNVNYEIVLQLVALLIFYGISVTGLHFKKCTLLIYVLYDLVSFLISDHPSNENVLYFMFIWYFLDSTMIGNSSVKSYMTKIHILAKIIILIIKNLLAKQIIYNQIDVVFMKNFFFSMFIYCLVNMRKEESSIKKEIEETKEIEVKKEFESKKDYEEMETHNLIFEKDPVRLENILDCYPNGILICKIDNCTDRNSISIIYKNTKAEEILNLNQSSTDREIIEQFSNFEMMNERKNYKNPNTHIYYTNFYDYILRSPSNVDEIQQRSIKYFNNKKIIVTQMAKYILTNQMGNSVENKSEYKIFSIENLSEEKKQMKYKIFKSLKSQFLLTISHELNNPLNGLIAFCEKLICETDKTKKIKLIEKIKKFRFSIKFFINNLNLTVKIVLKEKLSMDPKNLNLSHLLIAAINKFKPFFETKKIKYTTDIKNCNQIVIYYDYRYFKFFLNNILMYVSHQLEGNKIFRIESILIRDKKVIRLNFYKQDPKILTRFTSNASMKSEDISLSEEIIIEKTIQTEEMLKDVINALSSYMKIKITFSSIVTKPIISADIGYDHIDEMIENFQEIYEFSPESTSQFHKNMNSVSREIIMSHIDEINRKSHTNLDSVNRKNFEVSSHETEILMNVLDMDESGIDKIRDLSRKKQTSLPSKRDSSKSMENINRITTKSKFNLNKIKKKDYVFKSSIDSIEIPNNSINRQDSNFKRFSSRNIKNSNKQINIYVISPRIDNTEESAINDRSISQFNREEDKFKIQKSQISSKPERLNTSNNLNRLNFNIKSKISYTDLKTPDSNDLKNSPKSMRGCTTQKSECDCKNVLIVDDESFNIKSLKFLMKKFNVFPDACQDGKEAVDKVKKDMEKTCCEVKYKLILMDVMMPVMDGIEACKKIQDLFSLKQVTPPKIIILSAHDAEYIHEKFNGINIVHEFIPKPVKKSKIQEILNKFILNEGNENIL